MLDYALGTMSDATLPPLRPSSSEGPISSSPQPSTDKCADDVSFAAANSLDPSFIGNQSSSSDVKPKAKGNRKRTSPEDQAILEAEYKSNPKPDKVARLEIVKKVALNEKEVQIWFQNRRQNTRRKSRPLLPHEIMAFGIGGMAALTSDAINFGISQSSGTFSSSSQPEGGSSQEPVERPYPQLAPTPRSHCEGESSSIITPPKVEQPSSEPPTRALNFSSCQSSSQPILPLPTPAAGWLSNRRSMSNGYFGTPASTQHQRLHTPTTDTPVSTQPSSCPERQLNPEEESNLSSSQVRLSMSLDGKASLVPADQLSSPPPAESDRPSSSHDTYIDIPQRRLGVLQRSQSALPFSYTSLHRQHAQMSPSQPSRAFVPRMPSGRSRDARTWEFCCDSDARDELTLQAENESNGSAVAAISLLRSTSNSALKVNSNKRNVNAVGRSANDANGKRAKLGRAQSSLARLQGVEKPGREKEGSMSRKVGGDMAKSPSGDSDKENWLPREGGHRRNPHSSAGATRPTKSGSVSRKRTMNDTERMDNKSGHEGRRVFEDKTATHSGELPDGEVEKFMRGEISPSKKGDLDCIQGLLSLSQGNWR